VLDRRPLTVEDAYAYAKFARVGLRTNDIDFRPGRTRRRRRISWPLHGPTVSYATSRRPSTWSWSGIEPRRSARSCSCGCASAAEQAAQGDGGGAVLLSRGLAKLSAILLGRAGRDRSILSELSGVDGETIVVPWRAAGDRAGGALGRRALARTGASLAWVPRGPAIAARSTRAACPTCCRARSVTDAGARPAGSRRGASSPVTCPARSAATRRHAARCPRWSVGCARRGRRGPVRPRRPRLAEQALDKVGFLVSFELRMSACRAARRGVPGRRGCEKAAPS
jgi:NADH-quinone oxidoreductase subunit G